MTSAARPTDNDPAPSTLLSRMGGHAAVDRLVDRFYDRIEADAELRALFPENLGPGRAKQKLFFVQWLGGPALYSERFGHPRLRRRHFPFVIDERAAGRWLHHMTAALRETAIPEDAAAEIVSALGPLAHHMINAQDDVPRDPIADDAVLS